MVSSSTSSSDDERQRRRRQFLNRPRRSFHTIIKLMSEFLCEDAATFKECFGIYKRQFVTLQEILKPEINRSLTRFHNMKPLRGRDRLALCLRFLASGRSYRAMSLMYKIRASVIETVIREVCTLIIQQLQPLVMPQPTRKMWEEIAMGFKTLHQMPNCLGSVSGRYINVLERDLHLFLAIVDANHKFVMIDVGDYDNCQGIPWDASEMARRFNDNEMGVPHRKAVDGYPVRLPYVVVGHRSMPTRRYMLTKYTKYECRDNKANQVFNNRIHPIEETAQEAMNRLRNHWGIMLRTFPNQIATLHRLLMTMCCIENYFNTPPEKPDYPTETTLTDNQILSIRNMLPILPSDTLEMFHQYFLSREGQVPWQYSSLEKRRRFYFN